MFLKIRPFCWHGGMETSPMPLAFFAGMVTWDKRVISPLTNIFMPLMPLMPGNFKLFRQKLRLEYHRTKSKKGGDIQHSSPKGIAP